MPRGREPQISDYLVALVIVPLVSFVILQRWKKKRAARKEEIRKLLILAAEEEETVRAEAEAEAAALYSCPTVVTRPQCAICFSPTTTRCSRCKAVRYCSGKCQIVHWRQGHKYECQPPDVDDSDSCLPSISIKAKELDLNFSSETGKTKFDEASIDGTRTSDASIEKLDETISEKPKVSLSERSEDVASNIGPKSASDIPVPADVIPKAPDISCQSSTSNAAHNDLSEDLPIPAVPKSESSVGDVHTNCSEYPPDTIGSDVHRTEAVVTCSEYSPGTMRSDVCSTEAVITDVQTCKSRVTDASSLTAVNNVSNSRISTNDLPVLKNEKNDLPESGIALDSSSSEHNSYSSTSHTHGLPISIIMPDLLGSGNNPLVMENPVQDDIPFKTVQCSSSSSCHVANMYKPSVSTSSTNEQMGGVSTSLDQSSSISQSVTGTLVNNSSLKNISTKKSVSLGSSSSIELAATTNSQMVGASLPINGSSSTIKNVMDGPASKSIMKNVSNSGDSVTSFLGQKNPVSLMSNSKSSLQAKDSSSSTSSKSIMKNASNSGDSATSFLGQKNPVSLMSNAKSSLQTKDSLSSTSPVSQGSMLNDMNSKIPASKIYNQKASESNGTSGKSVRSVFQHSSPLKERAPVRSISRQKNGSSDAISFTPFHTVVSSFPTGNALKASVKKVAQQLKPSKASKQFSTKTTNDSSGKSSKLMVRQTLFPYEYFVKLFNWDKLELPPCGLINCGNSCYANVVLQCLTFTRPITAYLLEGSHCKTCQKNERNEWCFMCELQHLVYRMRDGKSPLSPIRILSQLKNIGNHLGYGREEDAHEFLNFALNAMQSACLAEAGGGRVFDSKLQETTLIQQIFGGYLQSKIKCLKCQYVSERYDSMMDLNVEILSNSNIESLQDALAKFTASETLDGDNKYKCGRCNSFVKAKKQLAVHEAPNILTIVLKRFQSGKFGKLNKRVSFPEILNMKPYMSGTGDKPPSYKLYAVVVHLDMMNASFSGHYVCYVKNLQGTWYKMNDCKVKQVELDRVLSQRAYMLFYSRSSPRPPPIIKNGIIASSISGDAATCSNAAKKPLLKNGLDRISVLDASPMTSCTVNLEDDGFSRNGVPSVNGRIVGSRDYTDWTSSDSGSLFSCSDETSCSTESNRDSTSTDDYSETIFGDSGQLMCTAVELPEDPYTLPSSFFCMKSSPSALQTQYYPQNDTFFLDSAFSNQQRNDDMYHRNKDDPDMSSPPDPTPQDTDGLPAWLSNSASSYFFPPSVPFKHVETSSCESDPSRIGSYWLDDRMSNVNNHAAFSQFQNSVGALDMLESGAHRCEGFASLAKSECMQEKYIPEFLQESAKLNFGVPPQSFDYCYDKRTSDTAHSNGLDR